jgi:ATPase
VSGYVIDTSALIARGADRVLDAADGGTIELIVPAAVVHELEEEAKADHPSGWVGLEEVKRLVALQNEGRLALKLSSGEQLHGRIGRTQSDRAARQLAKDEKAALITASRVQEALAQALQISVVKVGGASERLKVEELFSEDTMSVHLREGVRPLVKRGRPGEVQLEPLGAEPLTRAQVMEYIVDTLERTRRSPEGFVEIEATGATVVQYGALRIGIAIPPFADGVEMTVVRPVARPDLEAYELAPELLERLESRAEGVVIAGSPGAGKSTFARALAELYAANDKVVKTMESPRDLQVGPEVSQYGPLDGSFERTADILLLLRPDYTIFDELRRTDDFRIFADLRMAGVGMIGVTHSSSAIDAIQRFIGRVELGMLPQIIDTVVFVRDGFVDEVFDVKMAIKVPHGMTESDLARPVIVVSDFFSKEPRFEIYTFGDETAVVPVRSMAPKDVARLRDRIVRIVGRRVGSTRSVRVEVLSERRAAVYVPDDQVSRIIGQRGSTIAALERAVGIRLDVRALGEAPRASRPSTKSGALRFRLMEGKRNYVFELGSRMAGVTVDLRAGGETVTTMVADRKGKVKVPVRSPEGKRLKRAAEAGEPIEVVGALA